MYGGAREGAGRKKLNNVCYHRRVKPEWVKILDNLLNKLKTEAKNENRTGN